ncbi:MAG: Ig-like domain-containing protein, partial [Luteolibacter sp.]
MIRLFRLFSPLLIVIPGIAIVAADAPPVRILPLGDSITQGCCSGTSTEGGYRTRLYAILTSSGFNIDFVGSQRDSNNPDLPDIDHEGHGGDRINDIRNGIGVWLKESEEPDVILLHIGTNDFSANGTLVETQNRLRDLLAELSTARPHAKIIVSSLILRTDDNATEELQAAYNQTLPGIVSEQVALGRQVSFVDMHDALDPDDLNEGVHPKIAGYNKMADAWLPAITSVITPLGTANPPVIAGVDARTDLTHVKVTFSKPVEDAAIELSNFSLSGGVAISQAELDAPSKRTITLTTSPQTAGALYTLSVNGVRDRTPFQNAIPVGATREFTSRTLLDGSFEANAQGWTSAGSNGVADALPNYPATDGSKLMVFNGSNQPADGVVSQTVATIPGEKYKLDFDVGVYGVSDNSQSLLVTVEGNHSPLLTETEQVSGSDSNSTVWASKNYEFVANSTSTSLTFADTSATTFNADLLLDDVRLNVQVTPMLTVNSTPLSGLGVTVTPADLSSSGNGVTNFTRTYNEATSVNLTAPSASGLYKFQKWRKDGLDYSASTSTSVSMDADHTMSAVYNMLSNGGFEAGAVVTGSVTALDGWTVSGSPIGYIEDADYVAPEASRLAVFNGGGNAFGGTISQNFVTVPGESYDVDYRVGIFGSPGQMQRLRVNVTGTATPLATDDVTAVAGPAQWVLKSHTFVANSTTTTLTFTDLSSELGAQASNCDLLVDDVQVAVMTPNNAPVAVDDSYSTNQNVTLTVAAAGVLANDTDADFDSLSAVLVSGPSHGSVTLNPDGGFSYIPTSGYNGPDSFAYKANDAALDSNVATVSINVALVSSSLLANGSFENGAVLGGGATALDNWTVTGSPFGYVADASYTSTHGLRLTVFNGAGDAFGGTISQAFATTPGATYDLNFDMGIFGAVGKKQRLQVDVTGSASPLALEELTAAAGAAQWSAKSYTFVATGSTTTLTFTDASGALGALANNCDLLLDHVRVIGAAPSNTAPTAVADSYTATKNTQLLVSASGVLSNDTDPELNALTAILNAGPSHGSVTLNSNGSFTYTPTTDYVGADSFSYHANDGSLNSNVVTVSITVDPPPPAAFTNGSFESGTTGWSVSGNHIVIENDPPYIATDGTKLMVFNGGNTAPNAVISQTFATIPGQPYVLEFDMGVLAANTNEQRLQVSVVGTASLISQTESAFGNGQSNSAWVPKTYSFVADSAATTLTFGDLSQSSSLIDLLLDNVRVTPGAARTLSVTSSGSSSVGVTVTPNDLNGNNNGVTNFTRAYGDGATVNLTAPATVGAATFVKWQKDGSDYGVTVGTSVTMDGNHTLNAVYFVNSAPIAVGDSYSTNQNTQLVVPAAGVLSNDTDANSDPLTAVLNVAPANGSLTLNSNGGFTYTPTSNFQGTDSFTYHTNDGALNSNVVTVNISVVAPSLLVNGSFEAGVTGWTVFGNQLVIDSQAPYLATDGVKLMVFNGGQSTPNAVISQTFATTPGQPYLLEFDMGVIAANTSEQKLSVAVNGNSQLLTKVESVFGNGLGNAVWVTKKYAFVADGTSTTLSLNDLSPTTNAVDLLLDNIRVSVGISRILTVTSTPPTTATVVVSPADLGGNANGVTQFTRSFINGATINLTAQQVAAGGNFLKWRKNGSDYSNSISISVLMDADYTLNAVYSPNAAPVAAADSYSVNEDAELVVAAPGIFANDTDPEAGPFTAVLDVGPTHGSLTLDTDGGFTYTPVADYQGADSFTYHTNDGELNSSVATVSITVNPVNDAPIASGQAVGTDEDVPVAVNLVASDIDGDVLTYVATVAPQHGTLSGTAPNLTYTPALNYNGSDSFTFVANDGTMDSAPAVVSITIAPVPDPPVATAQAVNVRGGTSAPITLAGSDPDGDPITFAVGSTPSHGTLSGTAPDLIYTPVANYQGADSFTFTTNDGTASSAPAVVSITVAPVLVNGSFESGITGWTATGNYQVVTSVTQPPNQRFSTDGTQLVVFNSGQQTPNAILSQTFPTVPGQPYVLAFDRGFQSFNSTEQRLQIIVTGSSTLVSQTESFFGNGSGISVWTARSYSFIADSATTTLTFKDMSPAGNLIDLLLDNVRVTAQITRTLTVGSDPDSGVNVTVSPVDINGAGNGTSGFTRSYLDGAVANLTAPAVVGATNFQKWRKDGSDLTTNVAATVTMNANIALTAVYIPNAPPLATVDNYSTNEDIALVVPAATGLLANDSDPESVALTAVLNVGPSHGTLTLNANGSFAYTPIANFHGSDSFTYHAFDGVVSSVIATVTLTVNSINDAPSAVADSYSTNEDSPLTVPTAGVLANDADIDFDPITAVLNAGPTHGTLILNADGSFNYTPAANYHGPDGFSYHANDGVTDSVITTVTLAVDSVNDAPVAAAQSVNVNEDGSAAVILSGSDVDSDPLGFTVLAGPQHGALSGTAPNL